MSRFKDERERLGYGQSELAEKIDVTRRTMSRWENEEDAPIPSDKLFLCANLGFDVQFVITGKRQTAVEQVYTEDIIAKATKGMLFDASIIKILQIRSQDDYDLLIQLMMYNLKKASDAEAAAPASEKSLPKAAGAG
jgi:DNA-binding XRE family transcriptional regulator